MDVLVFGFILSLLLVVSTDDDTLCHRESDEVVEYFLEECASPQQLVSSYRPKMPPQSVQHTLTLI